MAGALIKFTQGVLNPPAGQALEGVTATAVVCTNNDNVDVATWTWQLLDVPPGSGVPTGTFSTSSSGSFTPDLVGGYLVKVTTTDGDGNTYTDYRAVLVPEDTVYSRIIPPFSAPASALNIGGQTRGWAPFMESYLHVIDRLRDVGGAAPTNGQVLTWVAANNRYEPLPSGGGSGITALTGDVTASGTGSVVATVEKLTGAAGVVSVVAASLIWAAATASPTLKQADGTTDGQNIYVQAQNAGGSNKSGGSLFFRAGNKTGSGFFGAVSIYGSLVSLGEDPTSSDFTGLSFIINNSKTLRGIYVQGDLTAAFSLKMNASTAGAGQDFKIIGQDGLAGNNNGGSVLVSPGAKTGSGTDGVTKITQADKTTNIATFGPDFIGIGATYATAGAQSGFLRLKNNPGSVIAIRDNTNSSDWAIFGTTGVAGLFVGNTNVDVSINSFNLSLNSSNNSISLFSNVSVFGDSGAVERLRVATGTTTTIQFAATVTSPSIVQAQQTSGSGVDTNLRAQDSQASGNVNGGSYVISSGAKNGTGLVGAVRLRMDTATMIEAAMVVTGNYVVSLAKKSALTSTEMPANTGDGVIFVGNAATAPTADPVSGYIHWADASGYWIRSPSGNVTQIAPP